MMSKVLWVSFCINRTPYMGINASKFMEFGKVFQMNERTAFDYV